MSKKLPEIKENIVELLSLLDRIRHKHLRTRIKALIFARFKSNNTREAIASTLGLHRNTVCTWLKLYENEGIDGLLHTDVSKRGRKPRIVGEALSQLKAKLNHPEGFKGYASIQGWLKERFALDVPYKTVYQTVRYKLNASPKVPRKSNIKKDKKLEEQFKTEIFPEELEKANANNPQNLPVKVFTQDETRLGLMTILRKIITAKGVKPVATFQQKYEYFYLYGVTEPATGDSFFLYFSHLDTVCFQEFINRMADEFPDTFNIILLDRGTFHRGKALVIPDNIHFIFQPPASPELNPIERLWEYIKDRLALENFDNLQELEDAVTQILKTLTHKILKSVTGFEYFLNAVNAQFK